MPMPEWQIHKHLHVNLCNANLAIAYHQTIHTIGSHQHTCPSMPSISHYPSKLTLHAVYLCSGLLFITLLVSNPAFGDVIIQEGFSPPKKYNDYEGFSKRGIWDYNFTDAKTGLYWELPDKGSSEGKAGNDPETPKFLQPTFQELNIRFDQVDISSLEKITSPGDDPNHAVLMLTQPITDITGRQLPLGMYSITLRPISLARTTSFDELPKTEVMLSGAVEQNEQRSVNQTPQRLAYPNNDLRWQTQQNPFNLSNPRRPLPSDTATKIVGLNDKPQPVTGTNAIAGSTAGLAMVITQQGVLKGVFPVTGQQAYNRTRHQKKAKPAFASSSLASNKTGGVTPTLYLTVGKVTYIASGQLTQPPVSQPTLSDNNNTSSPFVIDY